MKHTLASPSLFSLGQALPTGGCHTYVLTWASWKKHLVYGFPAYIDSNQGREFESQLLNELLQFAGKIDLQWDPQPERFNRTRLHTLRTLTLGERGNMSNTICFWSMSKMPPGIMTLDFFFILLSFFKGMINIYGQKIIFIFILYLSENKGKMLKLFLFIC